MCLKKILLVCLSARLLLCQVTDYYVQTTGTNNTDCSISNPCKELTTPFGKSGDIDIHVSAGESSPVYSISFLHFADVRTIRMFSESTNPTTVNTYYSENELPFILAFQSSVTFYLKGFVISNNGSAQDFGAGFSAMQYFAIFDLESANLTYENCYFKNRKNDCRYFHAFERSGGVLNFINCTYSNDLQTSDTYTFIYALDSNEEDIVVKMENCTFESIISSASYHSCIFSLGNQFGSLYGIHVNGCKFHNFTLINMRGLQKFGSIFGLPANNSESRFVFQNCIFTNIIHNFCGVLSVGWDLFRTFSVSNCSFSGISSSDNNGCIYVNYSGTTNCPTLTVLDCNFTGCNGRGNGGAIYTNVFFLIAGCVFTLNSVPSGRSGAAVFINTTDSNTNNRKFENCVFKANMGGAIGSEGALFVLSNVSFVGNLLHEGAAATVGSDVHVRIDALFSCATVKDGSCSTSEGVRLQAGSGQDQSYLLPNCGECSTRRPVDDLNGNGRCSLCGDEACYVLETSCAFACPPAHYVLSSDNSTCELLALCSARTCNNSAVYPCGSADCFLDTPSKCSSTCTVPGHYTPNLLKGVCELKGCADRAKDTSQPQWCGPAKDGRSCYYHPYGSASGTDGGACSEDKCDAADYQSPNENGVCVADVCCGRTASGGCLSSLDSADHPCYLSLNGSCSPIACDSDDFQYADEEYSCVLLPCDKRHPIADATATFGPYPYPCGSSRVTDTPCLLRTDNTCSTTCGDAAQEVAWGVCRDRDSSSSKASFPTPTLYVIIGAVALVVLVVAVVVVVVAVLIVKRRKSRRNRKNGGGEGEVELIGHVDGGGE